MQCTHGAPARLRCAPVPVPVSYMDRSWRHTNRSSKKKASPAPRTACRPGGRRPGIVAVMASAEAGEDTALPAAASARLVAVASPATQLAAPALHDDATPLPAPIQGLRLARVSAAGETPAAGQPASLT